MNHAAALLLLSSGLVACGPDWHGEPLAPEPHGRGLAADAWRGVDDGPAGDPGALSLDAPGHAKRSSAPEALGELFRNTYYDFPREGAGERSATVFDAACAPIAKVTQAFHDQVCVQGSGKLVTGDTISFAKRGCACAAVCPRTGQQICFERLDPARFPNGRGATGSAITPMRTVAVDPAVIPLGSTLFVPEFKGLPRPDGTLHDGCFLAEDRGVKVVGRHVDLFTGDPTFTAQWNAVVPSNQGVHVRVNDPHCTVR